MTDDSTELEIHLQDPTPAPHQDAAATVMQLDDHRRHLRETGQTVMLAAGAIAGEELIRGLRQVIADTKQDVTELMAEQGQRRITVGDKVVEQSKTRPTWHYDSDNIIRKVIALALGERYPVAVPADAMEAAGVIMDALRDVLPLTATGIQWRMGTATSRGLRDYLDPEDLAEHREMKREPRPTIKIT